MLSTPPAVSSADKIEYWGLHAQYQSAMHPPHQPPLDCSCQTGKPKPPDPPPPPQNQQTPDQLALYIDMRTSEVNHRPKPKKEKRPRERKMSRQQEKELTRQAREMERLQRTADEDETWFRHTHWKEKRSRVRTALLDFGINESGLFAFDNCGSDCAVEWNATEKKYRIRANYCHNRHCEPCARAKANLMAANLRERLLEKPNGRYRFITLTLLHSDTPLKDQITRLYTSFKKLRTLPIWKESQRGGCTVLEVKYNADTGYWHPHLHIIAEGDFLNQSTLSNAWLHVTGDSHVVDIRALNNERDAAHYVAKYVSKGTSNEVWYQDHLAKEWIAAMKGVRTAATFGSWRGFKLLKVTKSDAGWSKVGKLNEIMRKARNGDSDAMHLMGILMHDYQFNPHRERRPKAKKKE